MPERLDFKERKHLSVSEVKEFLSCPARWAFRYGMGLWTSGTNPYFALGNGVHAGLERWYWPNDPHNRDEAFRQMRRKVISESGQVDWSAAKEGDDPLTLRDKSERLLAVGVTVPGDDWIAAQVETTLYADIKHSRLGKLPVPLKIRPDMVLESHDFIDHKTADKTWVAGKERSEAQAVGYTIAGRQNFGHDPVTWFNIMIPTAIAKVDRRSTMRDQDDIDRFYGYARLLLDAEEKRVFYPNPTSWAHATCEFRRICDGWQGTIGEFDLPTDRALQALVPNLSDRAARVSHEPPPEPPSIPAPWDAADFIEVNG
jgi:hypothetical protein